MKDMNRTSPAKAAKPTAALGGVAAAERFGARQIKNLLENFERVNKEATDLSEELGRLRAEIKKGSATQSDQLDNVHAEIMRWKDKAESLEFAERSRRREAEAATEEIARLKEESDRAKSKLGALEAALALIGLPGVAEARDDSIRAQSRVFCSLLTALISEPVGAIELSDPFSVTSYYEMYGAAGRLETLDRSSDMQACVGWATAREAPGIAMLVTLYDDQGCIGVTMPSFPRPDVAAALAGCVQDCGFAVHLIRVPQGSIRSYLHTFPTGDWPTTFTLPSG